MFNSINRVSSDLADAVQSNITNPFLKLPDEIKQTILNKLIEEDRTEGEKRVAKLNCVCKDLRSAVAENCEVRADKTVQKIQNGDLSTMELVFLFGSEERLDQRVRDAAEHRLTHFSI